MLHLPDKKKLQEFMLKNKMVYTKQSFYDFDAVKLEAWLSVYLKEEGKNKYREKIWDTDFAKISRVINRRI